MNRSELLSSITLILTLINLILWGAMWYGYYTPTLGHYQESEEIALSQLEKKPFLVLTVYPSSAYNYSENYLGYGNFTFTIKNTTLVLSPGYKQIFHIFLSNVGTSPTVTQYLFVTFSDSRTSGSNSIKLNATILKPGDSIEWTWAYTVSANIKEPVRGAIAFSVMTTDGTISKTVPFVA